VVRQDEPTEDQSSIYIIFERLNTGGVNLQPQEIRVALYHGEFVRVLRTLNENAEWRSLVGKKSTRLKDMEMILRFFAMYFYSGSYRSPMKDFLNRYMVSNRDLGRQSEEGLNKLFGETVSTIASGIGARAFRPVRTVNAAVVDSVMTGVARRLARGPITNNEELAAKYDELMQDDAYRSTVETGTSQEANVTNRLDLATEYFSEVK
jgi:hypothetical protein